MTFDLYYTSGFIHLRSRYMTLYEFYIDNILFHYGYQLTVDPDN